MPTDTESMTAQFTMEPAGTYGVRVTGFGPDGGTEDAAEITNLVVRKPQPVPVTNPKAGAPNPPISLELEPGFLLNGRVSY